MARGLTILAMACAAAAGAVPAAAAVTDAQVTDVSPRGFSVIWVSDEPLVDATVKVFEDAQGTLEITSGLSVVLLADSFTPGAIQEGLVKVDVRGLDPGRTVYVQTQTSGSGGTVLFPASPPLIEARTAAGTTKVNGSGETIYNDLIRHEVFQADRTTPAFGALLLVEAPGLGSHPLSVYVGSGLPAPAAVVDLNNLHELATGVTADVPPGQILKITEYRGLYCTGLANHKLVRFRRAPQHAETGTVGKRITELELPDRCFFADTVCDDTVNILDVQRVLNVFNATVGQCVFNPDVDIVNDGVINILDVQSVLNRFGQQAPFP